MKLIQSVLAASMLAVPTTVLAASATNTLSVHVPFAFVMAGQKFEAGDYRVQQNDNGIICVQGSGKAAMAISVPGSYAKPGAASALQFTNRDAREHLVGVQVEGYEVRSIVPLRDEAERKVTLSSSR